MTAVTDDFEDVRAKLREANVNEQSLLATDYLNHFNEPLMILEMAPDMPESVAFLDDWVPLTYEEHFRESNFTGRDIVIAAYGLAPARFKKPFDEACARLRDKLMELIASARTAVDSGDPAAVGAVIAEALPGIRMLQETAGSIINGAEITLDQKRIDALLGS